MQTTGRDLWLAIAGGPLGTREPDYRRRPRQAPGPLCSTRVGVPQGTTTYRTRWSGWDGPQRYPASVGQWYRDEAGGASVNLLPGDAPRDIYQEVVAWTSWTSA